MISVSLHNLDGGKYGTLSLGPDGNLVAKPHGKRGENALRRLSSDRGEGQSVPSFLHHLVRTMPGRAVLERDDWSAQPHVHESLQLTWDDTPEATISLDGDRIRVQPMEGFEERAVRQALESVRRPHWSDADLFHALPEMLGGRLKVTPVEAGGDEPLGEPRLFNEQDLRETARKPDPLERQSGNGHAAQTDPLEWSSHSAPEPQGLDLSDHGEPHARSGLPSRYAKPGTLVRVVGGTGRVNGPPAPEIPAGPRLSEPQVAAGAMSTAMQAMSRYHTTPNDRATPGHTATAVWGTRIPNQENYPNSHVMGFFGDHHGNVWSRESLGYAGRHPMGIGVDHWFPGYQGYSARHESIPNEEPHFRIEVHPHLRAFLDAVVHERGKDPLEQWVPHFETNRNILSDFLEENGHPATEEVRNARFPDEVMDAIARHEAEIQHQEGTRPDRHAAPRNQGIAPTPHAPDTMGNLGAAARVRAGGPHKVEPLRGEDWPTTPIQATRRAVASLLDHHHTKDPASLLAARDAAEEGFGPGTVHTANLDALHRVAHGPESNRDPGLADDYWRNAIGMLVGESQRKARMPSSAGAYREALMAFRQLTSRNNHEPPSHGEIHAFASLAEKHGFAPEENNPLRRVAARMGMGDMEDWRTDLSDAWYGLPHHADARSHWPESARRFLEQTSHHGYGKDGSPERYAAPAPPAPVASKPLGEAHLAGHAHRAVASLLAYHQTGDHGALHPALDALTEANHPIPPHRQALIRDYADPSKRAEMGEHEHTVAQGHLRKLLHGSVLRAEQLRGRLGLGHAIREAENHLQRGDLHSVLASAKQHGLMEEAIPHLEQMLSPGYEPDDLYQQHGITGLDLRAGLEAEWPRAAEELLKAYRHHFAKEGHPGRHTRDPLEWPADLPETVRHAKDDSSPTTDPRDLGSRIGIDWASCEFTPEQLARGMKIEREHCDDPETRVSCSAEDLAKIAWAHLKERSDYYEQLEQVEKQSPDRHTKPPSPSEPTPPKLNLTGHEHMANLLSPTAGGRAGPETMTQLSDTVHLHKDPYGSHRLVKMVDGQPVAALQVMSADGKRGMIANAYTHPEHRRKGYASELHAAAKGLFSELGHSGDRSEAGDAWVKSLEKPAPEPEGAKPLTNEEIAAHLAKHIFDSGKASTKSTARRLAEDFVEQQHASTPEEYTPEDWVEDYKLLGSGKENRAPGEMNEDGEKYESDTEPDLGQFVRNQHRGQYGDVESITPSTGWLLSDGTPVEMGDGRSRGEDHRGSIPTSDAMRKWGWPEDVIQKYDEGTRWPALSELMRRGNMVRIMTADRNTLAIDSQSNMTRKQRDAILDYVMNHRPKTVIIETPLTGRDGREFDGSDVAEIEKFLGRQHGRQPDRHASPLGAAVHRIGRSLGVIPHPEPEPLPHAAHLPDGKAISAAIANGSATLHPIRNVHRVRVSKLSLGGKHYALKEFHDADHPDMGREVAASEVSRIAGVLSPRMRQVTVHHPGGSGSGTQALVSEWADGHPVSELPADEAVTRLGKVDPAHISRTVLHDFMTGFVDSHQGNYILTPDNQLVSIDRPEAFGNNWSAEGMPPSHYHRILKMHAGVPQTLDRFRPGEAAVGADKAAAVPLNAAHARDLVEKAPEMAAALRSRGMDREANFVERRSRTLQAFAESGGKTVADLERLAREHSGAKW